MAFADLAATITAGWSASRDGSAETIGNPGEEIAERHGTTLNRSRPRTPYPRFVGDPPRGVAQADRRTLRLLTLPTAATIVSAMALSSER
jgi:hypothetical protein